VRLLIGLPGAGHPTQPFLDSLAALRLPPEATAVDRYVVTGNFIPGQRELCVRRALALRADVLVMIDDDMHVPPDALVMLCDALVLDPSLAVAGALYYSRDGIRPMAATRWTSANTTTAAVPGFGDGVVTVDAVGFGCVALRVAALGALQAPYFDAQIFIEEAAARVRLCNEDFLLCERLRGAGYGVALHAGVRCGHYDRERATIEPRRWESPDETRGERMIVMRPGPHYELVPYDAAGATAAERHAAAHLDYVSVD
jgi:GT2 family glycosyltransferase